MQKDSTEEKKKKNIKKKMCCLFPCLSNAPPFMQRCAGTEEKERPAFIHKVIELLENTTAA